MIVKALYSPLIEEPEQDFFIFTNELPDIEAADDDAIRLSPSVFQEALLPKTDYRVTVVGEQLFPVKIKPSDPDRASLDWRIEKDGVDFVPCSLPSEIEFRCRELVGSAGLLFGAIDLVEHAGDFYFLEINPNGEWGWLQRPHGIPIAQA